MEHFYDFGCRWRILFVLAFVSFFIISCTDENFMIEKDEDYVFMETYAGNINNSAKLEITPESSESASLQLEEQPLELRVKLFCENSSSNYRLYKIKLLLNDEDILLERETSSINESNYYTVYRPGFFKLKFIAYFKNMQYYTYDQSESEATIVVDYPDRDVLEKAYGSKFQYYWMEGLSKRNEDKNIYGEEYGYLLTFNHGMFDMIEEAPDSSTKIYTGSNWIGYRESDSFYFSSFSFCENWNKNPFEKDQLLVVGTFHTHRELNRDESAPFRIVGASPADERMAENAINDGLPGLVFDFVGEDSIGFHEKIIMAGKQYTEGMLYGFGPKKRGRNTKF